MLTKLERLDLGDNEIKELVSYREKEKISLETRVAHFLPSFLPCSRPTSGACLP